MRSSPWRMIVGSFVPSSSIRLRTTSVATCIALFTAAVRPDCVGVSTIRVESTTRTSQSRWPVTPTPCVSARTRSTAASS